MIRVFETPTELASHAADQITAIARESVAARGHFTLALSGGSTPAATYRLLAEDAVYRASFPWQQTHFFWGDERPVPPDHPDSCYLMAYQTMLSKVAIPEAHIHRIKAELDPKIAAAEYIAELSSCDQLLKAEFPRFDLILLGFGAEGHTASLFPGTKALAEQDRWVVPNWVGKLFSMRITLTAPVINAASHVLFLVTGQEKALALKGTFEGLHEPEQMPAQLIKPQGQLSYFLDQAAASALSPETLT